MGYPPEFDSKRFWGKKKKRVDGRVNKSHVKDYIRLQESDMAYFQERNEILNIEQEELLKIS